MYASGCLSPTYRPRSAPPTPPVTCSTARESGDGSLARVVVEGARAPLCSPAAVLADIIEEHLLIHDILQVSNIVSQFINSLSFLLM